MQAIANAFGVTVRTVQRAVESKAIPWRGKTRRGRYAAGITLADAAKWSRQRGSRAPAWTKAARMLGDDWRTVMAPVLSAAFGGADIDLIGATVATILGGGGVLAALKRGLQSHTGEGFGFSLAKAILAAGGNSPVPSPEGVSFRQLWNALQTQSFSAPVDVLPGFQVAFDSRGRCRSVTLQLFPAWLPTGQHRQWPDYAWRSVVQAGSAFRVVPGLRAALNAVPTYVTSPAHWKNDIDPLLGAFVGGLCLQRVDRLPNNDKRKVAEWLKRAKVPRALLEEVSNGLRVLRGARLPAEGGVIRDKNGKETRLIETISDEDQHEAWRRAVNRRTIARVFHVSRQAIRQPRLVKTRHVG